MSAPFCQHCITLHEIPGEPTGSQKDIAGVGCYVAQGSGNKGTVLLATDIYGLGIQNPKIIADTIAKQGGFQVVVPDVFKGDAISPNDFKLPKHSSEGPPSQEQQDANGKAMGDWVGRGHSPDETFPLLQKVLDAVKSEGPVGIIGYCYGGRLAATAAIKGLAPVVINHPAMLSPEEASQVQSNVLLNQADFDPMFSGEVKETWNEVLKKNGKLSSLSKTYPSTVHGFGCRPDLSQAELKTAYEQALANSVAFFKENLTA